jgi:ABC-2 type transport system permease protein
MTWTLTRKLLRDVRVAWIVVAVLLFLFQILWARITSRVSTQILTALQNAGVPLELVQQIFLGRNDAMGQLVQAIIGGEDIALDKAGDMMTIAYVHPLVLTILCIWAIGRAANAIAGEIDRGTLELLLAQPIRRSQVILAHLCVDAAVFPTICIAIWLGTWCGTRWMGLQSAEKANARVDPYRFIPALLCILALLYAVSGVTMSISAMGRSRARVWGWAVTLFLSMFLINVLGQIWNDTIGWLRPFTVYYHYQPQFLILHDDWYLYGQVWFHLGVLFGVGTVGYACAWIGFCRRDLPAPL